MQGTRPSTRLQIRILPSGLGAAIFLAVLIESRRQLTEVAEQTPRSLYLTAALLIREGFISLEDLYPHVRIVASNTFIGHR